METIQINSKADLIKRIREAYGEQTTHNIMGGVMLDNATYSCSAIEAEKIACEDFYEGTILVDQSEGYIKLNIPEAEIMEVLWSILSNDPRID